MPNTAQLEQIADQWLQHLLMCSGLPMTAPACGVLWTWVVVASLVLGGALLAWAAWSYLSHRRKYAAALKAELERERVADAEEMEKHRVRELADVTDVTDPHLAEKIRAELERQKRETFTGRGS